METNVFILFREYADTSKAPSCIYINANDRINSEEFLQYFNEWMKIVEFFQYERCNKYYDKKNLESALYPFNILLQEYSEQTNEYPDASFYVLEQLKNLGIIDWQEESIEPTEIYLYNKWDVTNSILGEIARKKHVSKACVLLNCDAISETSPIKLLSSSRQTINVEHTNSIKTLYHWFCQNRIPQRQFDYNPKHGDDKHLAQMIPNTDRRAAQLEVCCSKAQELLNFAIGTDLRSALWFYDTQTKKYIYFENQREKRLAFHGYHLQEGDENFDNIDRNKINLILK